MRTDMKMTIQDYFKRSGIRQSAAQRHSGKNGVTTGGQGSFSQALASVQSSPENPKEQHGLTIRDYVARPVPAKSGLRPYSLDPPPPAIVNKTTAEAPPKTPESSISPTSDKSAPDQNHDGMSEKEKIIASIDEAAKRYNLPKSLIRAVVQAESDYQVRAVSPAGAQGLMQLMPATARELGVDDPFDINQNIDGGSKYLRKMLDRFKGDIKIALSAYNAGPGTVSKYNGNVPYTETRNYVARVMRFSRQFS